MPFEPQAKAIVEGYLLGQAGAEALAKVLYGKTNPSGKLAETFPQRLEDTPCFLNFPGEGYHVEYREGIFVGYRYYDTCKVKPLFCLWPWSQLYGFLLRGDYCRPGEHDRSGKSNGESESEKYGSGCRKRGCRTLYP